MNNIYLQFDKLVIDNLKKINKNDGYNTDPSILNGWLSHYVSDLLARKNSIGFPSLSVNYSTDTYNISNAKDVIQYNRRIIVEGAIVVADPNDVNRQLDELLDDVVQCLMNVRNLTLVGSQFMIPEGVSTYAMFELKIDIKLNSNRLQG